MINYQVSLRQRIGPWWTERSDDAEQAGELRSGILTLEPHPSWHFGENIDWDADPFEQKNWRFQLHCLKWLEPLRRIASAGGPDAESSKRAWNHIVQSWISSHLLSNDKFAWMDMADGLRAIEFVLGAPIASEALLPKLVEALHVHVDRLLDPTRRARGNHAMHQLTGLFVSARFLGLEAAEREAVEALYDLFTTEYDVQGTNAEASVAYHDMNFHWWNDVITRLEVEGVETDGLRSTIERSRASIVHFVRPDGFLEMIGDTAEGKILSSDNTPENLYVRSKGAEGKAPVTEQLVLDAGYALGRSSWGDQERDFEAETFYSLRFGRNDAVHGHDDLGSITVFADSVPWLVDPGMYAYQSHPFRTFFKSRHAHNVVVAPDLETVNSKAELNWSHTSAVADAYQVETAAYSGYNIYRTFAYVRLLECFVVYDVVEKTSDQQTYSNFVQRWNFHPSVSVSTGMRSAILRQGEHSATMRWLKRPILDLGKGNEKPLAGWFSPTYAVATPTQYLDATPTRRGDLSWCTVISVGQHDVVPLTVSMVDQNLTVSLEVGPTTRLLTINQRASMLWEPAANP